MSVTLIPSLDLCACDLCSNVTPVTECPDCGERHCAYCFDAYGCDCEFV